jgi:anti-anti-sigma factor
LLLKQEGGAMFSVDLSTRECDGHVIVALRGELDILDAAGVAGALAAVTAREPRVIVDLAGLDFIDASGLAALVSGWKDARRAGGDLLLAAPQPWVLRVLAATRLLDLFSVHPSVEEAVSSAGSWRRVAAPVASPVVLAAPLPRPGSPQKRGAEAVSGRAPEPPSVLVRVKRQVAGSGRA